MSNTKHTIPQDFLQLQNSLNDTHQPKHATNRNYTKKNTKHVPNHPPTIKSNNTKEQKTSHLQDCTGLIGVRGNISK